MKKDNSITNMADRILSAKPLKWSKPDPREEMAAGITDIGALINVIIDMKMQMKEIMQGRQAVTPPQVTDSIMPVNTANDNAVNLQGMTAPGFPGGVDSRHAVDPDVQGLLDANPNPTPLIRDSGDIHPTYDERGFLKTILAKGLRPDGTPRKPIMINIIRDGAGNFVKLEGVAATPEQMGSAGNEFVPRHDWGTH